MLNSKYEDNAMIFWDREFDAISVAKYRNNMTIGSRTTTCENHGTLVTSKATLFAELEVRLNIDVNCNIHCNVYLQL